MRIIWELWIALPVIASFCHRKMVLHNFCRRPGGVLRINELYFGNQLAAAGP